MKHQHDRIIQSRLIKLAYGLASYLLFLGVFLYAVGFTGAILVPKAIDDGAAGDPASAIAINLALLSLFAVQHSVMARPAFKRWWTRFVPPAVERSTFVLLASLALALLFWQWRPMPAIVWSFTGAGASAMVAAFWAGWGIVLLSTFLISHFELFGVRQVIAEWAGKSLPLTAFKTPALYRFIRHPIYLGFIVAFWAAPTMSVGHLLFSMVTTAYILVGIQLEERDLLHHFGEAYAAYRRKVGMLVPRLAAARPAEDSQVSARN